MCKMCLNVWTTLCSRGRNSFLNVASWPSGHRCWEGHLSNDELGCGRSALLAVLGGDREPPLKDTFPSLLCTNSIVVTGSHCPTVYQPSNLPVIEFPNQPSINNASGSNWDEEATLVWLLPQQDK